MEYIFLDTAIDSFIFYKKKVLTLRNIYIENCFKRYFNLNHFKTYCTKNKKHVKRYSSIHIFLILKLKYLPN